jgi:hypothetical protein
MYTSILLFSALLSSVSEEALIVPPPASWHEDYDIALKKGVTDKKPMVIVVGEGRGGWQSASKEGEFSKDVRSLLEKSYVCLFVDTSTNGGKKLAAALAVDSGPALIIGDRSGTNQAFRYKGALSGTELTRTLKRFADAADVAVATESTVTAPAAPQRYSAPPAWGNSVFMGGGGGGC